MQTVIEERDGKHNFFYPVSSLRTKGGRIHLNFVVVQ